MNLTKIHNVLTNGGKHLGDLVWWSLTDARTDRVTLEKNWNDAGLDVNLLPDVPTADRALKLAVRESQVGNRDRLIRLGLNKDTELVFAVVREHRDEHGNVSYQQEARMHLDRSTERLTSDADLHDIVRAVTAAYQAHRATHPSDDVRKAIVKALTSWRAVMLREGGGIYWVPNIHADELRRLQSAIERIGASRVYVLPVHESPDSNRALGQIATASLEDELAQLQTEIATFVSAPPDRASTLMRRLDAFDALRNRARLYRSILSVQVTDLDEQLDRMAATVEALVQQKVEAA